MAFRSDIEVFWHLDPRIIEISAPSVELTIQDLYDTLRQLEQRPQNMAYPKLCDAGGKLELGPGLKTVISLTLLDALLQFEARPGPVPDTQCIVREGNLVSKDTVLDQFLETPFASTDFTQVNYAAATTGAILGQPVYRVDQGWVDDSKLAVLRSTIVLHKDGQFVQLNGSSSLSIEINDDTGGAIHTSPALPADGNGMFHHAFSFVPQTGRIYTSKATITVPGAEYVGVEILSVAS